MQVQFYAHRLLSFHAIIEKLLISVICRVEYIVPWELLLLQIITGYCNTFYRHYSRRFAKIRVVLFFANCKSRRGVAKSHFAIVIGKNVHYARWATTVGLIYGSPRRCWRHKSVQKLLYFLALWLSTTDFSSQISSRPKYAESLVFF